MRHRGGSFHTDVEMENKLVEFITPHYEEIDSLEPLDLSKMCLDDENEKHCIDGDIEQEEEIYTRGRSRSRSVHENDADPLSIQNIIVSNGASDTSLNGKPKISGTEKTGPLPVREVLALRKVEFKKKYKRTTINELLN
jgi:hypothetical protein